MPNRLLREGIVNSRAFNSLSDQGQLFYYKLLSVVDDYGRFEADIELLRGELFKRSLDRWPLTRVSTVLTEVSNVRTEEGPPLVLVYGIGVRTYLQVSNFNQRLRAKSSKYPEPILIQPLTDDSTPPSDDGHMSAVGGEVRPSRSRMRSRETETESASWEDRAAAWKWFVGEYPKEVLENDLRLFNSLIETPEDIANLRTNLPLWKSVAWAGEPVRFVPTAETFLSKRMFNTTPKPRGVSSNGSAPIPQTPIDPSRIKPFRPFDLPKNDA